MSGPPLMTSTAPTERLSGGGSEVAMAESWSRRQFLSSLGYVGAAGVFIGRGRPPFVAPGGDPALPTRVVTGVRRIKLPDTARHPAMCDWTPDGRWCLFACQDTNN